MVRAVTLCCAAQPWPASGPARLCKRSSPAALSQCTPQHRATPWPRQHPATRSTLRHQSLPGTHRAHPRLPLTSSPCCASPQPALLQRVGVGPSLTPQGGSGGAVRQTFQCLAHWVRDSIRRLRSRPGTPLPSAAPARAGPPAANMHAASVRRLAAAPRQSCPAAAWLSELLRGQAAALLGPAGRGAVLPPQSSLAGAPAAQAAR